MTVFLLLEQQIDGGGEEGEWGKKWIDTPHSYN